MMSKKLGSTRFTQHIAAITAGTTAALLAMSATAQTVVQSSGTGTNMIVINGHGVDTPTLVVAAGPETSETRALGTFHAIAVGVPAIATFTVAATPSVRISTQANVLPIVVTQIENGTLKIGIHGAVQLQAPIRVDIAGPSPDAIAISGTGQLTAPELSGRALALNLSGNAQMQIGGHIDHVSVNVAGTGTVDTSAIHARSIDADVSGTATMRAFASESARLKVSGVGNIHIAGQPAQRTVDRSGLATVSFE